MKNKLFLAFSLVGIFVLSTGCAINRSVLTLPSPELRSSEPAATQDVGIIIRSIEDERVFVAKPKKPSEPSVGFEGAKAATPELISRIVSRKINTYGWIMGDVVLDDKQTVKSVITEYLKDALVQEGYQLKELSDAAPRDIIMDVHIGEFWTWNQINFWDVSFFTKITTDIALSSVAEPLTITLEVTKSSLAAFDSDFVAVIVKALKEYQTQVRAAAKTFPKQ